MQRIGVISDTHGLLRPEAIAALQGVDRILHAGDIGGAEILEALGRIAPVTAVRGNNDRDAWARHIREREDVEIEGHRILVLHDLHELGVEPAKAGYAAVITGHSHKPKIERRDEVLFLNPGSAGPRRFTLPISLAILSVGRRTLDAEILSLEAAGTAGRSPGRSPRP